MNDHDSLLSESELKRMRLILDRAEIRERIEGHLHAPDSNDWDVFESTYASGARLEMLSGSVDMEAAEFLRARRGPRRFPHSTHALGNVRIVVDGDSATSSAFVVAFLVTPDEKSRTVVTRGIRYEHRWIRTDDGWRATHLVQVPEWQCKTEAVDPGLPAVHTDRTTTSWP